MPTCPLLLYRLHKVKENNEFVVITDGCMNGLINVQLELNIINITNVYHINNNDTSNGIDVYLMNPREYDTFLEYAPSSRIDMKLGVQLLKNVTTFGKRIIQDYGFEVGTKYVIVNRFKQEITTSTTIRYGTSSVIETVIIIVVVFFGSIFAIFNFLIGCFLVDTLIIIGLTICIMCTFPVMTCIITLLCPDD